MTKDELIIELQEQVRKQKSEILKIEKPNWKTSCSFKKDVNSTSYNLHTITDVNILIMLLSFLINLDESTIKASKTLKIGNYIYLHDGFPILDWIHDVCLRYDKLNIINKKSKLEEIETRLLKLESPEMREKKELEDIIRELSK